MRRAIIVAAIALTAAGCVIPPEERKPDPFWADRPVVTFANPGQQPIARRDAPLLLPVNASTFEDFLKLPQARMDPGLGALLFGAEDFPGLPIEPYLRRLDELAQVIHHRTKGAKGPEVIDQINQLLYFDEDFRYDPKDPQGTHPDNLYLHRVLRRKKGYCVSLGVLYLALARRLGLPVYGVRIPSHFIVRYDDGKTRRNIETTDFGIPHPDRYYIDKYRISRESIENGVYLKNLNTPQVFVDMFNNRGTLKGLCGDWRGALKALNRGLAIDKRSPFLLYNRGVILSRLQRTDLAEKDFKDTLSLDPNNFYAMNNLAEIYANRGEFSEALGEVNRALDVYPEYSNGYLNRGVIFHKMGKFELALENVNLAVQADDHNGMAYVYRARMMRERHEPRRAIYDLNRAVTVEPEEPQAWAERGFTYLTLDRLDRALPDFDKAVQLAPMVMEYRLNRGIARLKAGDMGGAKADFDKAVALAPNHTEPLLKRAALYLLQKRFDQAVADLDKAVALDRDHPLVLLKRGVALLGMGRKAEAEADLVRAVGLAPRLADGHKHLGLLYARSGDAERARFHLETFLSLEPDADPDGRALAEKTLAGLE